MRRILLFLTLLLLVPAAPAAAGTLATPNVCQYSLYRGYWFNHSIDLSGTASPNPVAPASGVALTQASAHARLPDWVAQYAANAGILQPGDNAIPAKVWIALAADTGTQVVSAETVAHTNVTFGPDGFYQSSTPIDVTLPLPDTAWSAPAAEGTLSWRQGAPGSLPALPAGANGATVTPRGSVLISAVLGGLTAVIDCLPGTENAGRETYTAVAPGPFESVPVQHGATALPAPVVVPKKPVVKLRSAKRSGKKHLRVALACADAACKGAVTATYGGGAAARRVSYSLAAGARKTVRLRLSAKALKSLKRTSVLVRVKVTTSGGKAVTKKLRLKK